MRWARRPGRPPTIAGRDSVCAGDTAAFAALAPDGAPAFAEWFLDGAPLGRADTLNFAAPNRPTAELTARFELSGEGCAADTATISLAVSRLRARNVMKRDTWGEDRNNGFIALSISGGFAPYRYRIHEGQYQANRFFRDLPPGVYLVEATDGVCALRLEEITIR